MTDDPDALADLGLKACPQCFEPMEPAGEPVEHHARNGPVVTGSAWWACPRCGMTALI